LREFRAILVLLLFVGYWDGYSQSTGESYDETAIVLKITSEMPADSLMIRIENADDLAIIDLVRISLFNKNVEFAKIAEQKSVSTIDKALSNVALLASAPSKKDIYAYLSNAQSLFKELNLPNLSLFAQLLAARNLTSIGSYYVDAYGLSNEFLNNYTIKEDLRSFAIAWNILGLINRLIHNNEDALKYYLKASEFIYNPDSTLNFVSPLINIGTIYQTQEKYDSAILYYNTSVKARNALNDAGVAYIKNKKAEVYLRLHKYDSALRLANESHLGYQAINHSRGLVHVYGTLASIHTTIGDDDLSKQYAIKGINLAKEINYYRDEVMETCQLLVELFEKEGSMDNALKYQKIYSDIYANQFGPEVNLMLFKEQFDFLSYNQKLENELLVEQKHVYEAQIQNQKLIIIFSVIALIFTLAGFAILLRKNRVISDLLNENNKHKEELNAQAEELLASNQAMDDVNSNLEQLVQERSEKLVSQNRKLIEYAYYNAHVVRGPLARILGLVNIMEIEQKKETPYITMLKGASEELDASIKQINSILEKEKGKYNDPPTLKD